MNSEQIAWPCELSSETKLQLTAISRSVNSNNANLPANHWLMDGVYYLRQGMLTVTLTSDSDKQYVSTVIAKGDWFGVLAIERSEPMVVATVEVAPSSYWFFPAASIDKLAKGNAEIYKWLYFAACQFQPRLLGAMMSEHHSRRTRVVYVLLELSARQTTISGALPQLKVSQQKLSEICCLTRPRLNEVLKALQHQGLIVVQRGAIQLLDLAALEREISQL
jgi:CRP-like cAMP-binding protein